ncbi:MAG: metallophosphoesterase [Candidatus Micrarchaeota archaeon]
MKLVATSDLHFGSILFSDGVETLVKSINAREPDAVMVLGDHCHGNRGLLKKLFGLYKEISLPLLLCMGNHDYWVSRNQFNHESDSLSQREHFIKLCKEFGFHCLDEREFVQDGVAFVGGSMWYDYSFRPQGVSEELAALKQTDTGRWNDLVFVKLPYDDKMFLEVELDRLEAQLKRVKDREIIVSGTHFLPFRECVTSIGKFDWDYFNSFMGSTRIGELLLKHGVKTALYGHSHSEEVEIKRSFCIQGVKALNVAYSKKQPFTELVI